MKHRVPILIFHLTVLFAMDSFACSISEDINIRDRNNFAFISTPAGYEIDGSKSTYQYFSSITEDHVLEEIKEHYSSESKTMGYIVDINYVSEKNLTQIRQALTKEPSKAVLVFWGLTPDCTAYHPSVDVDVADTTSRKSSDRLLRESAVNLGRLRDEIYWIDNMPTIDMISPVYPMGFKPKRSLGQFTSDYLHLSDIEAYKRLGIRSIVSNKEFLDYYELLPYSDDDKEENTKARHSLKDWIKSNPDIVKKYPLSEAILDLEILDDAEQEQLRSLIEKTSADACCWSIESSRQCYIWSVHVPFDYFRELTWSGKCVNNRASGEGTLTFHLDGDTPHQVENGNYVGGKLHGKGKYMSYEGHSYEGEWVDGYEQGHGVYIDAKGDRYEGQWEKGAWHGRGVFINVAGDRYEGRWEMGNIYIDKQGDRFRVNKDYMGVTFQLIPLK